MRHYFAFVLGVVTVVSFSGALAFYATEAGRNPNVRGFGDGLWWAVVTILGYGDIVPRTTVGRLLGVVLMVTGLGAAGIFTASIAAYLIRLDRLDALRIRSFRDHVIICGLGEAGQALAQAFDKAGYRVLAIEKDENNPQVAAFRDSAITVMIGDAARPETLQRARLHQARHLIVVGGSDSNNVEIAAHARTIPRRTEGFSCSTEIRDPELWYALRTWELATRDGFRLEFFNLSELGARALLARYPPFAKSLPTETAPAPLTAPHVLIVGAGPLTQSLIPHMVRQWRDSGRVTDVLSVTLIDDQADSVHEHLHQRHPELNTLASIRSVPMDLRSAAFHQASFLFDKTGRCLITIAYVCVEAEQLGLSTSLLLMNHLRRFGVPVVVRLDRQGGFTSLLEGAKNDKAFEGLRVFGLLEQACQPELVLGGTKELLARALHEDYLARLAPGSANPARVPWDQLPLDLKESNRRQADAIVTTFDAAGCYIVPVTALDENPFAFEPGEIERLATMEHERWVAERRALGWTLGPRDPGKRTNPNLVAWSDLDEATRNMNRDFISGLPAFLARPGFTVRRYQI